MRLIISHTYNFVPIFSCLMYFGAMLPRQEYVIPLLALIGTDILLTEIQYGYPLTADTVLTWLWYLVAMVLGAQMLRTTLSVPHAVGGALLASVSFFLASNFAVWALWDMYSKSWNGLIACYIAGLPFSVTTWASEVISSVLICVVAQFAMPWIEVRTAQRACVGIAVDEYAQPSKVMSRHTCR